MLISEIWNKLTEFVFFEIFPKRKKKKKIERERIFQKSDGDFKILRNEWG